MDWAWDVIPNVLPNIIPNVIPNIIQNVIPNTITNISPNISNISNIQNTKVRLGWVRLGLGNLNGRACSEKINIQISYTLVRLGLGWVRLGLGLEFQMSFQSSF